MDFITGLPKSEGKNVIMVVVDRLTKYAHFCELSHPFKVSTVANSFMETIQNIHGNPNIIVSDKDSLYLFNNSNLKQKILLELHTSPLGGHSGFLKTYHRVKKEFFWDGLKSDI